MKAQLPNAPGERLSQRQRDRMLLGNTDQMLQFQAERNNLIRLMRATLSRPWWRRVLDVFRPAVVVSRAVVEQDAATVIDINPSARTVRVSIKKGTPDGSTH
jgi:hypothetical protein